MSYKQMLEVLEDLEEEMKDALREAKEAYNKGFADGYNLCASGG